MNDEDTLKVWDEELEALRRKLMRFGPDEVCCEGLSPRQCAVLRTLVAREGARISDLAEASSVTPSAMTRLIERLEGGQLVQRVRGTQTDGRAAMVRITERGRAIHQRVEKLSLFGTETLLEAIPADQRETILESIRVLNRVLGGDGCCVSSPPCPPAQPEKELP